MRVSELRDDVAAHGRSTLQSSELSEVWDESDRTIEKKSKGGVLCHVEMEQVQRVWDP